uniref:Uncharacterized protein n=1 Tax=Anguilla anguilla TaxID=7936 RepID=A0A0E9WA71_ANGAN
MFSKAERVLYGPVATQSCTASGRANTFCKINSENKSGPKINNGRDLVSRKINYAVFCCVELVL